MSILTERVNSLTFINVFANNSITLPLALTLMLKTSSAIDSLTIMTQIIMKYKEVDDDGGGGKLVEKLLKVEKLQRFEKSTGLEELSFLTLNTRLVFTKDGFQLYKTHNKELLAIIEVFKN